MESDGGTRLGRGGPSAPDGRLRVSVDNPKRDGALGRPQPFGVEGRSPFDKTSGRMGAARRPVSAVAPRRPMRAPDRQADPLVDVHFDGVHLIVTTEIDLGAEASVDDARLILRSATAPERILTWPCRVKPDSLRVRVVNGILEATMIPEDFAG